MRELNVLFLSMVCWHVGCLQPGIASAQGRSASPNDAGASVQPEAPKRTLSSWGWGVGALGAASLLGSVATYVAHANLANRVVHGCGPLARPLFEQLPASNVLPCLDGVPERLRELQAANISTFVIGLAGVAGGATMITVDLLRQRSEAVAVALTPSGARLEISF